MATVLGDQYVTLGVGTTAQRPATPDIGATRLNSTFNYVEHYDTNSTWQPVAPNYYNILTIDASENLSHNQVKGSESDTTVDISSVNPLSAFFSGKLAFSIDSLGNLVATF
jgi:hypothetical protein